MSLRSLFGLTRGDPGCEPEAFPEPFPEPFVERRAQPREAVFQEVVLTLEDYHRIRAVVVNLSSQGARIHFSDRTELPFRIRLSGPTSRLTCWARVVWQVDEAAGLEFLPDAPVAPHG